MRDFGESDPRVGLHVDASAAKGMVERKGFNKVRHIDMVVLWLQEQYARRLIPLEKCVGTGNVADRMTKHLTAAVVDYYSQSLGVEYSGGLSAIAQKLH